jgi:hypothetical protein
VRRAFDEHRDLERQRPVDKKVEGAVVVIGLEQPVEPQEGGEQSRDP